MGSVIILTVIDVLRGCPLAHLAERSFLQRLEVVLGGARMSSLDLGRLSLTLNVDGDDQGRYAGSTSPIFACQVLRFSDADTLFHFESPW